MSDQDARSAANDDAADLMEELGRQDIEIEDAIERPAASTRVPLRVTCDKGHEWSTPFPAHYVGTPCPTCHRLLHHVERATK